MKKLYFLLLIIISVPAIAQNSGLGFNYQAIVRNIDGILLADSDVSIRISLYPGQQANNPTWVEVHNTHTDISGCFGITVGHGQRDNASLVANYTDINFAAVYYWMKIEVDEGGTYREVSFAQLPSSPYSEVAHNAILMPAGSIIPFAGPDENVPDGWILCDGRELSRTEYQRLYDAIGVAWGTGDGATTFNIPDLRGMFLRGKSGENLTNDADADSRLANNYGGNSGNNVGSFQGDAIRNITGEFSSAQRWGWGYEMANGAFTLSALNGGMTYEHHAYYNGNPKYTFNVSNVVPVGSDNRPKNVYVNYIIKY